MSELATVNRFLNTAHNNITSAQLKLDVKKEELKELESALTKIGSKKSAFISEKGICLKPKFTAKTLKGDNAEEINDYRDDTLEAHFLSIPKDQISEVEEEITTKIQEIKEEIESLGDTISSEESNIESLSKQKSEVLSKS